MRSRLRVRSYILFQLDFLQEEELRSRLRSWRVNVGQRSPFEVTILFVPVRPGWTSLPPAGRKTATKSSYACVRSVSVIRSLGTGVAASRRTTSITTGSGFGMAAVSKCGRTFTFLPVFSLPYTHYSLVARCHALLRRFVEHCSWERAVSRFKDADRCRIPRPFAAGRRVWIVLSRHFLFCPTL